MKPETFRKLAALGLSTEQMAGVLEIMEAETEERRAKGRKRWREWDDRRKQTLANVGQQQQTTANDSRGGVTHGLDITSNLEISGEDKKDTSPSARSKRGERIPDNFEPDTEWAQSRGLSPSEASFEAEQFIDYWRGKPGKDGLKLDWQGTWRMWVRNAIKRRRSAPRDPPPKPKKITAANMWRDDAIAAGIIHDPQAASTQVRHDNPRLIRGQVEGPGLARRFASA
jgi:hypothetical protein